MNLRGQWVFVISMSGILLGALAAERAEARSSGARQEYGQIIQEQKQAQEQWDEAYKKAKTDEEKSKLKWPSAEQYAERMLAVARKYPDDPAALDALIWIGENCRTGGELDATLRLLLEKYSNEPKIGTVVSRLLFARSKETEPFLRGIAEKSSSDELKGKALLTLGRILKERVGQAEYLRATNTEAQGVENYRRWLGDDAVKKLQAIEPEALRKEAESTFETVIAKYGNQKGPSRTLGESAKGELFEMRQLGIGMVAPEIKGQDVEGRKFALSEYRGKVVVLDFWGHW